MAESAGNTPMLNLSLAGRVALVTGAGRGIGAGIVEVFLQAGATVIANALSHRHLGKLVERLGEDHGGRIIGLAGDVASANGATDLVTRASQCGGPIDILVNGAGDAVMADLVEGPGSSRDADAQTQAIIDLNLMSAIHCTRAVGRPMMGRARGRIINIAGVVGALRGESGLSVYSAGKAGLIGFTRSLAREWAPYGITVNAIAPGVFPDRENLLPEHYAMVERAFLARIPLGRFGESREIGHLAAYLACDVSGYLTGQVIAFDGGLSA